MDDTTSEDTEAPKPKRPKLTAAQKIARYEQRIAQLKARESRQGRKAETREKIIIGGAVVKAMRTDAEFRERIVALLRVDVTRVIDQRVIASWLDGKAE